jgi:two-component system phosphate regulon sensor histidine kinase PhoR
VAFACFTGGVVLFQRHWERGVKIDDLKSTLDNYARITDNYIKRHDLQPNEYAVHINNIVELFPENMRFTIIDISGKVLFDNKYSRPEELENHLQRNEVREALAEETGSSVRISGSTGINYFYFARRFGNRFVRIALPYDIEVRTFLRADNMLLYFTLILFVILLLLSMYISRRLGKSMTALHDFAFSVETGKINSIKFPNTEFGETANQIIVHYRQLEQTKNQLVLEKEKLVQCFQNSEEGIGVFSETFEPVFVNSRFVTCANIVLDGHNAVTAAIFGEPEFARIRDFVAGNALQPDNRLFTCSIVKNGKHFSAKCIIFSDKSFEIILNDVTASETTRLLKQEMTNNIAHELRTPVSSIRGYLETILEQKNLDVHKQQSFIERSYRQTLKLSELIRDISLITKIEEAPQLFVEEDVNIADILHELGDEFETSLRANNISFDINVPAGVALRGNRTLIYAVFRNLVENSVAYAGKNITITIEKYDESEEFYFFSYTDTGTGVAEEHLAKMFNRFYRIDEGRTRDSGGSGLGLAIVKNAIMFHHGEIVAKNRKGGGLEFLFMLGKR